MKHSIAVYYVKNLKFRVLRKVVMDVSDVGSRGAEDGIALGEGWYLQICGVTVRGRRKSVRSEEVREWGVPLSQSRQWEILETLPSKPLGLEEERSSGRVSVNSLELFAATNSLRSPRPTLDEQNELESHNAAGRVMS